MISAKALELVIDSEGCDLYPSWAGGDSGITYGYGYDLGYNTKEQIKKDWDVADNILAFMLSCSGVTGEKAKILITPSTKLLRISKVDADATLQNATLPRFRQLALNTYPGLDQLNQDTIGAITSLIYNRGSSMGKEGFPSWNSRKEMRELKPLILQADYDGISNKIKEMSRLWIGKGMDGLIIRREKESLLVSNSI